MSIDSPEADRLSPHRAASPAECVVDLVARERRVPKTLFLHHSRCRADVARARQLAMYLMHVALGTSLTAVGAAFGRDRTTVSHACALIEDMRDDPDFDHDVERLEGILQSDPAMGGLDG